MQWWGYGLGVLCNCKVKVMRKEKNKKPWSRKDEVFLFENGEKHTSNYLSKLMDRTIYDIERKVKELNVELLRVNHAWSEEDLNNLREIAHKHTVRELSEFFPHKTNNSIYSVMKRNNIRSKKHVSKKELKRNKKIDVVIAETITQAISRKIEEKERQRRVILKQLNGRYNEELYSQLNSINTDLEQLKKIEI